MQVLDSDQILVAAIKQLYSWQLRCSYFFLFFVIKVVAVVSLPN